MKRNTYFDGMLACAGAVLVVGCRTAAGPSTASHRPPAMPQEVVWSRDLPSMSGGQLRAHVLEVVYQPGDSSKPHSHPCVTIGHVVEGALRMRVDAGPDTVYRAGDTFYEAPNSRHLVSANASATQRARFVVFFFCQGEQRLSVPLTPAGGPR